jgi:hypothetical protein
MERQPETPPVTDRCAFWQAPRWLWYYIIDMLDFATGRQLPGHLTSLCTRGRGYESVSSLDAYPRRVSCCTERTCEYVAFGASDPPCGSTIPTAVVRMVLPSHSIPDSQQLMDVQQYRRRTIFPIWPSCTVCTHQLSLRPRECSSVAARSESSCSSVYLRPVGTDAQTSTPSPAVSPRCPPSHPSMGAGRSPGMEYRSWRGVVNNPEEGISTTRGSAFHS